MKLIKHVTKGKSPTVVWYPFGTEKDAILQAKYDVTMVSGAYDGIYEGDSTATAKKIHGKELP